MGPTCRDTNFRSTGMCNVCGKERIQVTRVTVTSGNGIRIGAAEYSNCECGETEIPPDPARTPH